MIVHLTTLKTAPKNVSNIVKLLYRDEIVDLGRQFNLLSMLTVESKLEPGRVLSASTWESVEAAQVALSNPAYAQLVKKWHRTSQVNQNDLPSKYCVMCHWVWL